MILYIGKIAKEDQDYLDSENIPHFHIVFNERERGSSKSTKMFTSRSEGDILKFLKKLHTNNPITGIITTYEKYIELRQKIGSSLNIPTLSEHSLRTSTDKAIMREAFLSFDKSISPNYQIVESFSDAEKFADEHNFPVMLKPTNLQKSLLITKNTNKEQLLKNYSKITELIQKIYDKEGILVPFV